MREQTGHITEDGLKAWASGTLTEEEQQSLFAHIAVCDYCAELFASYLEQDLAEPPAYLHDEILERSQSLEVRTARTVYRTSKQMRLFLYSLKVGLAVAVSLLALFIAPGTEETGIRQETHFLEEIKASVTEATQDGSDRINVFIEDFTEWFVFMDK